MHKSITLDRVISACQAREDSLDNPGFCRACGADHDSCEPDAEDYECYSCGEFAVDGAEMFLFTIPTVR